MKMYKNLMSLGVVLLLLFTSACEDETIVTNDVQEGLIKSTIDPLTQTSVEAGSQFTITGTHLDLVTTVTLAGNTVTIEEKTGSSLTFNVPKIFAIGPISVTNKYRQITTTEETLAPIYEDINIAGWPADFEAGQPIVITGTNVHLINKVVLTIMDVNTDYHPASLIGTSYEVVVNGASSNGTTISVATRGLGLPYGASIVASAAGLSNITGDANSPVMTVLKPSDGFDAVDPIVLWDFEDGVNPYEDDGTGATVSINGGTVKKARGNNYLHMKASNADGSWLTYGTMTSVEVNPGDKNFHDPYISFLVNTNEVQGYFHMNIIQGGVEYEAHFSRDPDNYLFETDGWEWRSYPLTPSKEDAGEWKIAGFVPMQPFQMQLVLRTGNVNGPFEVNLDQVMITDGKVQPYKTLWDFEGADPFVQKGETSTYGFNLGGVDLLAGEQYYTVKRNAIDGWKDFGELEYSTALDLSELNDPYLNFWINSNNSDGGYFQLGDGVSGNWAHFTGGFTGDDYKFVTDGWERRSVRLSEIPWEGEVEVDIAAFKPVLTIKSGNVGNGGAPEDFELNIDEVTISDGPMF